MKFIAPLALAAGMASFASAQFYPTPTPDDIDWNVRKLWCTQQTEVCPAICQDQSFLGADTNECDPDTLAYTCICEDGRQPNLTEYSVTLPYNICQWSKQECVNNCKGEATCSNLCFTGKNCGATDPRKVNVTSTATSTASKTGTATPTGTDGGDEEDKFNPSMGQTLSAFGSVYGVGVMVAGIAVGFWGML
ncbi:hypothetical protein DFH27DRAFT_529505 [Peziza echinospora]|nr:hypothetical protein DFH27DRAFT_529505 [Peziza echinospora]